MYLKKLSLTNFKCFESVDIDFHEKLTVIVGQNGAGKTTVMEGAAIAISTMFMPIDGASSKAVDKAQVLMKAYNVGKMSDVQRQYPVTISAIADVDGREIHWERSLQSAKGSTTYGNAKEIIDISKDYLKRLGDGDETLVLPVLAYYGTGRLWDYHREKQTDIFETSTRTNGYIDSVDGTANIKLMMNWFRKMTVQKYQNQELGLDAIPALEAVLSAMETCYKRITGCETVKVQYNMGTQELDVAYKDEDGNMMRVPMNQLSDGYKGTISLVADIAYRMAVLNPQLMDSVCKETGGVVLIDEVDLHLHPAWQQRILADLTEIFPKVQFIVSTHAPEVINSVQRENVVILENQSVNPALTETYGKDANGVLRTIMGVNERPKAVMDKFRQFYHALDVQDYLLAEQLLSNLEEALGDDPELASMRVQLDVEQI